jgi:catechol 2,3-dioxygenase
LLIHTGGWNHVEISPRTNLISLEQPEDVLPKQSRTTGLYHFAILLPNRKALSSILHHFIENRYPLQGASNHHISEAVYLADPDGNGVEVYADTPPSTWIWVDGQIEAGAYPLDTDSLLAEAAIGSWKGLPAETLMGHIH